MLDIARPSQTPAWISVVFTIERFSPKAFNTQDIISINKQGLQKG